MSKVRWNESHRRSFSKDLKEERISSKDYFKITVRVKKRNNSLSYGWLEVGHVSLWQNCIKHHIQSNFNLFATTLCVRKEDKYDNFFLSVLNSTTEWFQHPVHNHLTYLSVKAKVIFSLLSLLFFFLNRDITN